LPALNNLAETESQDVARVQNNVYVYMYEWQSAAEQLCSADD